MPQGSLQDAVWLLGTCHLWRVWVVFLGTSIDYNCFDQKQILMQNVQNQKSFQVYENKLGLSCAKLNTVLAS